MWGEQEGCSCAGGRGTQRSREPASARESRPGAGVWGGLEWCRLLGARALRCLVSEERGAGAKAGWGSAGSAELVTVSLAMNTQTDWLLPEQASSLHGAGGRAGCGLSGDAPVQWAGSIPTARGGCWHLRQLHTRRAAAAVPRGMSCPCPALPALPSCLSSPQTLHLGCRHSCVLAFCPLMNQVSSEFISLLCFAGLVFVVPGEILAAAEVMPLRVGVSGWAQRISPTSPRDCEVVPVFLSGMSSW